MALLLARPDAGFTAFGILYGGALIIASVPAYLGHPWGVRAQRHLYQFLLGLYGLLAVLYFTAGPIGGGIPSPKLFFGLVLAWTAAGARASR